MTGFEVVEAETGTTAWTVMTADGRKIRARYIVNAAGLHADSVSAIFGGERFAIAPRKGEEYLLDRSSSAHPNHVLFPVPARDSKGMLVIPTVEGTTMVGPTAEMVDDKDDVTTTRDNLERIFTHAKHMMPAISRHDIITAFSGLRPAIDGNDFFIAISGKAPRLIQVAGIQSPGLTASPAIAEYVKVLLKKAGLRLTEKEEFEPKLLKVITARTQSPESMDALVRKDPSFGNIVCRCETVSEAEIVEAIRKGHTTLDGIKFYTRSGMGRCQGGFCTYKILKILARETGRDIRELTKRGEGSTIVTGELGEFRNEE
jgi:glycerol-3-phosphate dehydrogenase